MQVNLEQILAHANERLSLLASDSEPAEQVEMFKKFLKVETERLKMRHRFGVGGIEIARGRSYLVDLVVRRACQLAAVEINPGASDLADCSVIALGGYARRDLSPYSDIDVLFLHARRRSTSVAGFVERVLYLLWDIGLIVGHSVRSIGECVEMASSDLHSRTALSEARVIAGSPHLFRRAQKELASRVYSNKKQTASFLETMRQELEARYSKFGGLVGIQEPNVKESAGGLRDLHSVVWIGQAKYGCTGLDALRAEDFISGQEYASARRAYEFIMRVRNEAHFLTGRKSDLLTLDLQPSVAEALGYKGGKGLQSSELFMRDYYQRARDLHQFLRGFLKRAMGIRQPGPLPGSGPKEAVGGIEMRQGGFFLTIRKKTRPSGKTQSVFDVRGGEIVFASNPDEGPNEPIRVMEAFSVAQKNGVGLGDGLTKAAANVLPLVGQGFRSSKQAVELFMEMLSRRGRVGFALRLMHDTSFLGRFLPEFGKITFLVQHDFYHRYTIDEHMLKAVEALDELGTASGATASGAMEGRLARVFDEVDAGGATLYLAVLLHDLGKGHGSSHVPRGVKIAEKICARFGLDSEMTSAVVFLVQNHLLMSHLAQRRDVAEQSLVEEFVGKVKTLERLNMLLLLTYADMSGVGPGVWNDWKASLLWELYSRARRFLGKDDPAELEADSVDVAKEQVIETLLPQWPPSEVERHLAMLPVRYVRVNEPDQMARHFRLVQSLGSSSLAANWRTIEDLQCTELTICGRDSVGLFAKIAGTLTAHGVNIMSADLYTRQDGIVIDTFKVGLQKSIHPVRPEQWKKIELSLVASIEGRYDVAVAVEKWLARNTRRPRKHAGNPRGLVSVHFDQHSSAGNTVVEVRKRDEPGLAYKIASRLTSLGLSINFAKIATEKGRALDIFYVTDPTGNKLSAASMPAIEDGIVEALKDSKEDARQAV
jgi:[protein-PII] uridylyltransferase